MAKKRIVVDARMVSDHPHGIAKYIEGIAEHLSDGDALTHELLSAVGETSLAAVEVMFLISPHCPIASPVRKFRTIEIDISCYHPKSWVAVPRVLRSLPADLFFNPTFASYPSLPCDYIQTIHDLNHLYYGNTFQKLYYQLLLKPSAKRAKKLFTVSYAVQKELTGWLKIDSYRILVFYNEIERPRPVVKDRVDKFLRERGLQTNGFFFCVSNPKPHKNLELLYEAYAKYSAQNENALPLAVTVVESEILNPDKSGIIALGAVSDEELSALYQSAKAFFFPSLYEGFGRPPIEAALAGVPVYASDIPPHQEGKTLFNLDIRLVNPKSVESWVEMFQEASR